MRGRLQKVAAAVAAASAMTGGAAQPESNVGSVPLAGGWRAHFYVSPTARDSGLPDDALLRRNGALGVNAQLSRRIAKDTRLSMEVTNLFDRDAFAQQGLALPADGRGVRLGVRVTFR